MPAPKPAPLVMLRVLLRARLPDTATAALLVPRTKFTMLAAGRVAPMLLESVLALRVMGLAPSKVASLIAARVLCRASELVLASPSREKTLVAGALLLMTSCAL